MKPTRIKGLMVLGFPCNQFANQDPASDDEISQFCELNYGVTFPMFAKIDVNGDGAHPLFKHLKTAAPGLLGSEAIKWNFTKFLVDRNGKVVERYAPRRNRKRSPRILKSCCKNPPGPWPRFSFPESRAFVPQQPALDIQPA
jgi:glutathione peroxidase-family protein